MEESAVLVEGRARQRLALLQIRRDGIRRGRRLGAEGDLHAVVVAGQPALRLAEDAGLQGDRFLVFSHLLHLEDVLPGEALVEDDALECPVVPHAEETVAGVEPLAGPDAPRRRADRRQDGMPADDVIPQEGVGLQREGAAQPVGPQLALGRLGGPEQRRPHDGLGRAAALGQLGGEQPGSLAHGDEGHLPLLQHALEGRGHHAAIPGAPIDGLDVAVGVAALQSVSRLVEDLVGEGVVRLAHIAVEARYGGEEDQVAQLGGGDAGQQVAQPLYLDGVDPLEIGLRLLGDGLVGDDPGSVEDAGDPRPSEVAQPLRDSGLQGRTVGHVGADVVGVSPRCGDGVEGGEDLAAVEDVLDHAADSLRGGLLPGGAQRLHGLLLQRPLFGDLGAPSRLRLRRLGGAPHEQEIGLPVAGQLDDTGCRDALRAPADEEELLSFRLRFRDGVRQGGRAGDEGHPLSGAPPHLPHVAVGIGQLAQEQAGGLRRLQRRIEIHGPAEDRGPFQVEALRQPHQPAAEGAGLRGLVQAQRAVEPGDGEESRPPLLDRCEVGMEVLRQQEDRLDHGPLPLVAQQVGCGVAGMEMDEAGDRAPALGQCGQLRLQLIFLQRGEGYGRQLRRQRSLRLRRKHGCGQLEERHLPSLAGEQLRDGVAQGRAVVGEQ